MAVELNVRTQLSKIVEDLELITKRARTVGEGLKASGEEISEHLNEQTKKTETYLERLRSLGGRVAEQLRGDFRSLVSLNAVTEAMRLSEQFRGSIKEAFTLTDAIRKLGPTLGIVSSDFVRFQSVMMKGLGEIGLSSEAAANALGGISQTPVRGESNIIEYAKTAGELGSVTREQGKEGEIAKALAGVLVAQGRSPNDMGEMRRVSEDVLRIRYATGQGATEALGALSDLYGHANKDFLPRLRQGGGVTLASAALLGGADATSFLRQYVGMDRIQRMGLEEQGFRGIINGRGELDAPRVASILAEARGRGLGDAQAGLKTFGLSDEQARGFIRLGDALSRNADVIERAKNQVVDLTQAYHDQMGIGEAFRANLNRVKGMLSTPLGMVGNAGANALEKTSESDWGSLAVTAGGGILAALLGGFGLKGIGSGLGIGKGLALEKATGGGVQAVYVTNAKEIGGGGLGSVAGAAGLGAILTGEGLLGGAMLPLGIAALGGGAVGLGVGSSYNYLKQKYDLMMTPSKSLDTLHKESMDKLAASIDRLASTPALSREEQTRLIIENRARELKMTREPSRGTSFGP